MEMWVVHLGCFGLFVRLLVWEQCHLWIEVSLCLLALLLVYLERTWKEEMIMKTKLMAVGAYGIYVHDSLCGESALKGFILLYWTAIVLSYTYELLAANGGYLARVQPPPH